MSTVQRAKRNGSKLLPTYTACASARRRGCRKESPRRSTSLVFELTVFSLAPSQPCVTKLFIHQRVHNMPPRSFSLLLSSGSLLSMICVAWQDCESTISALAALFTGGAVASSNTKTPTTDLVHELNSDCDQVLTVVHVCLGRTTFWSDRCTSRGT